MTFRFKGIAAAAAAIALSAVPTLASAANPAASLSVAKPSATRAATVTTSRNKLAEGSTATYINIGILAALVVGVLLATSGGDDDSDSN